MNQPNWKHGVLAAALYVATGQMVGSLCAQPTPSLEVLSAERNRVAVIERACRASISVFGPEGSGGGSGVIISADGYALSNFHVVKPCGDHMKCSLPDGQLYDAVVVGIDPVGDVGLIKLLGRTDFPFAEKGDSQRVRVGQWCFAVGNPFLLATDFQPTVTYGIVSGVHRYQYPAGTLLEYTDCIQTDASINPGNSGGPLFNENGQLVGINGRGSFEKRGRVNVGVAYAISINQINNFLGHLRSGRIVDHATLGATVSTAEDGRVVVVNILESSDAYRRGLRMDDEVISFGGRSISSANAFKNVLGTFPKGWRVPLSFFRDGQRFDVRVRLTGVHSQEELLRKIQNAPVPPTPEPEPEPDKKPIPKIPVPSFSKKKAKVPEHVQKLIETRRGYANYYFNRQQRDLIWSALREKNSLLGKTAEWTFEGTTSDGREARFILRDTEAFATLPDGQTGIDLQHEELDTQLAPEGSGGLLLALSMWRRLLSVGPEKFGEVFYLGQVPVVDRDDLIDVLVGIHDVVETRFYVDPDEGHLHGLETFPDRDVDPCELYFTDFREINGAHLPGRIHVRYGDNDYANLRIGSVTFSNVAETAESVNAP